MAESHEIHEFFFCWWWEEWTMPVACGCFQARDQTLTTAMT